jgi:Putative porin
LGVILFKKVLIAILLLAPFLSLGQFPGRSGAGGFPGTGRQSGGAGRPIGTNSNTDNTSENQTDTPKKGKILDDSTKQIYGPKTVNYFFEEDIYNNRKRFYQIDTLIDGFHIFNFLQKNSNLVQDLGNMGTATRPLFYTAPELIGAQIGYNAFDVYHQNSSKIRYFDTKSPYTNMYYVAGGRGEAMLKFDFNRSVNARWNIGIQMQNFKGSKQYGNLGGVGQLSTKNWNVILHNSYFSKDSNYTILANFNFFSHESHDDGGVDVTSSNSEDPFLNTALTKEKRKQLHIYHQYALANGFQLYHIFDLSRQNNIFNDTNLGTGFSTNIYKSITAINDTNNVDGSDKLFRKYRLLENKVGIKGFINGFNYRLHLRNRDYKLTDSLDNRLVKNSLTKRNETFLGAWVNYYFKDSTKAFAETEYRIGRDFNLRFEYLRKHLDLGYYLVSASPTLMQERFYSSVLAWNNKLDNSLASVFYGKLKYKINDIELSPSGSYSILGKTIYFDTLANPQQTNKVITILQIGTGILYKKGKFTNLNQLYFNVKTGPDLIRMPSFMANSRVSYDFKYAKILFMQLGLELNYKSAYYANAYMPVTQQFYLQDKFKVKPGLLADVFLNMRLNRVRFLVKYSQLNQLVLGDYYVGPNFKGLKGGVSFGLNWPLFD